MAEVTTLQGSKGHLVLANESAWGTVHGSPAYVHVPVTDYGVKFAPVNRQGRPAIGLRQAKQNRNVKGMVQGTVNSPLYGWQTAGLGMSLAEYLMTWAFANPESLVLPSKYAEWAVGPNVANKRHLGLRVNQATLSGSEDQGITLALDLMGQDEILFATAQTLPANRNRLIEFEFEDCTFSIDGTPVPIGSFQWQIQNALTAHYWNSRRPSSLPPGDRVETFSVTPPKQTNAWQEALKENLADESVGVLTLKGLHNGTGTVDTEWNQVVITFPLLSLVNVDEQGGRGTLMEPLSWVCLKPDTADNASAMVWTDEE